MHHTRPHTLRLTLRRSAAATACAALAVFSLSACGGDDTEPTASEDSSSSASESPSADGSPSEDAAEGSPTVDAETNSEVGDRVLQSITEGGTAHVTMEIDAGGQKMTSEGDVDFTTDPMSMTLTMTGGPTGEMELRMVDGTVYMKGADTGGKFFSMPATDAGSMMGFDPQAMLKELEGFEGGTKVDDDHYRYDIQGTTADIYFEDDRLSRMVTDGGAAGSVTITYTDWGKDVEIEAPPADQVQQMPAS